MSTLLLKVAWLKQDGLDGEKYNFTGCSLCNFPPFYTDRHYDRIIELMHTGCMRAHE